MKENYFIFKNSILKSENIMICCDTCIQKGPTLILAFLIRYSYLSKEIAIEMIRTKNPNAFKPNLEYSKSIDIFTKDIEN